VGLFAATGSPPFGPFLSEFIILRAALAGGHTTLALVVVGLLATIFAGMAVSILRVVHGEPSAGIRPEADHAWLVAGPMALALGVLLLGLYLPAPLGEALRHAAASLGGNAP
jgi:hydrogenase-4 component F